MNAKQGKTHMVGVVVLIFFALALAMPGGSFAKIPEPDNIVYGVAGDDAATIRLEVGGTEICSYTMGDNPDAGAFYILRVPMDSVGDPVSGTARPGDTAYIYIDGIPGPTTITLGERGSIYRLDLGTTDDDSDGMPDQWEQRIADANPNDAIYDASDVDPKDDFDYDGFSNARELLAGSDAADTERIPQCIADINTDGDVDGMDLTSFGEDYPLGTCECPSDMDGDGVIDDMDFLFFTEDYGRMDCYR